LSDRHRFNDAASTTLLDSSIRADARRQQNMAINEGQNSSPAFASP